MKKVLLILVCFPPTYLLGQQSVDSIKPKELQEIMIRSWIRRDIDRLPELHNSLITIGKKVK